MKNIAIVSAKGGVGRTTIAANLGFALRASGEPVLVVEMDPQNALRFHLGYEKSIGSRGLAGLSLAGTSWKNAVVRGESGVHFLPFGGIGEEDRLVLEDQLRKDDHWLSRHLEELDVSPDTLLVIDVPAGPSIYMKQVLACADLVIVVMQPDAACYVTLPQIESLIARYSEGRSGYLGHAFLVNRFDGARSLAKDTMQVIRNTLDNRVIGAVHWDPMVGEALALGKTVIEHIPSSQACVDLVKCSHWVIQQLRNVKEYP